jgi:hypothetical protein
MDIITVSATHPPADSKVLTTNALQYYSTVLAWRTAGFSALVSTVLTELGYICDRNIVQRWWDYHRVCAHRDPRVVSSITIAELTIRRRSSAQAMRNFVTNDCNRNLLQGKKGSGRIELLAGIRNI